MILYWTQSLLKFLLWYAVASLGGCLSYWILRLAPLSVGNAVGKVSILVAALCFAVAPGVVLAAILVATIPSCAAAFCEKAMDKPHGLWSSYFGLSIVIYLLSFVLNGATLAIIGLYSSALARLDDASMCGVGLGVLLTPFSISLFHWIIHTYQFRPGLDRHFEEGEHPE